MRDDSHRWDAPSPLSRETDGLKLTEVASLRQHMVSGTAVLDLFADRLISWPDCVDATSYALTLRRDRVLVVGGQDLTSGYHAGTGLAVTDMSDAYAVIEITGPKAFESLRRGGEIRLDRPSRSVVRQLFGCDVMLYRINANSGFRLHVLRAAAQSLADHLCKTKQE